MTSPSPTTTRARRESSGGRSARPGWRRVVITAAFAAVIAAIVYLVIGSITGGLSVPGFFRVMGITAGTALVVGTVMTAIATRMRRRHGGL